MLATLLVLAVIAGVDAYLSAPRRGGGGGGRRHQRTWAQDSATTGWPGGGVTPYQLIADLDEHLRSRWQGVTPPPGQPVVAISAPGPRTRRRRVGRAAV
ncbi:hypothetical protein MAHJHV55_52380 [Mycobacterium avium subsp. hominissuis]